MQLRNTKSNYGSITRLFHWVIFILFMCQFYWIGMKNYVLPKGSEQGITYLKYYHKSVGAILLFIGIAFFIWKLANKKPSWPSNMNLLEYTAAKLTHFMLYLIILAMPISGVMMSMGSGFPVKIFDLYTLPMLIDKSKYVASIAHDVHEICGNIAFVLIIIHILAAFKHHIINKDNILTRMLPFRN